MHASAHAQQCSSGVWSANHTKWCLQTCRCGVEKTEIMALPQMTHREIYEFMNGYFGIIRPPYILILPAFTTYSCINFPLSFNCKHIFRYFCTSISNHNFFHKLFFFQINTQLYQMFVLSHFYWSVMGNFYRQLIFSFLFLTPEYRTLGLPCGLRLTWSGVIPLYYSLL